MTSAAESWKWPGTPCVSQYWMLTADLYDYMARRGVAMLAQPLPEQTPENLDNPRRRHVACADHLRAASALRDELQAQEYLIAAEAIAHRIPYEAIGQALSVTATAAHNAFAHRSAENIDISCLSGSWPTGSAERRAARYVIRQAVVATTVEIPRRYVDPSEEWIGLLSFLKTARALRDSTARAVDELVAELRTLDVAWREIGGILGCSAQAAQRRFRRGIDDARYKALVREKRAIEALADSPDNPVPDAALADITPGRALVYAIRALRRSRDRVTAYGEHLMGQLTHPPDPGDTVEDELGWLDPAAQGFAQAATAVLAPGVVGAVLEAGPLLNEVLPEDRNDYTALLLHIVFMIVLCFGYTEDKFTICLAAARENRLLTERELNTCVESVIAGAGVAEMTLTTIERLQLDELIERLMEYHRREAQ